MSDRYTIDTLRAMWIGVGPDQEMRVTFTHWAADSVKGIVSNVTDRLCVIVQDVSIPAIRADQVKDAEVRSRDLTSGDIDSSATVDPVPPDSAQ